MLNPLRDPQDERPVSYCDHCWGEIFSGETVVFYDNQWICSDCFQAAIDKILRESISTLADAMQLNVRDF